MNNNLATEFKINIGNFEIAGKKWGKEKNSYPILALHGWLDNANSFDKIAPILAEEREVLAIDLAGHGLSNHRSDNTSYYIWDYAWDLLKLIEKLKWKKIIIIAHSMGTGIASILASSIPKVVTKLIFIDGLGPPFVLESKDILWHFNQAFKQSQMAMKTKLHGFSPTHKAQFENETEAILERMENKVGKITFNASSILIKRSIKKVEDGYRWTYDPRLILPQCFLLTEDQAQFFISKINCSTLIILGKQGLFAQGLFKERLEKFNHATIEWFEGGHHLHLEAQFQKVAKRINNYLKTQQKNETANIGPWNHHRIH